MAGSAIGVGFRGWFCRDGETARDIDGEMLMRIPFNWIEFELMIVVFDD